MIVAPTNHEQWLTMAQMLNEYAGVQPSPDLKLIGWASDAEKDDGTTGHKLVIVVGFNGFIGSVAQVHFAYAPGWNFTPRQMLRAVFRYAFVTAKRELLLGVVNSKNVRAMRMDIHLGFTERFRLPGMHDDGGDIVLMGMDKSQCVYLGEPDVVVEQSAEVGHA